MSSRARQAVGSLLGVGLVLALAATARSDGPLPRLTGPALAGPTHLQLVVAGAPPYIYDVDTGSMREIPGVVTSPHSVLSVERSGQTAVAVVDQACNPCAGNRITYAHTWDAFRIRLDGSVRRLAGGRSVTPAHNSSAIWALSRGAGNTCRLKLIPSSRPAVRAPCGFLRQDSEAGLIETGSTREMLVDTRTGRVRASGLQLGALHGDLVLQQSSTMIRDEGSLNLLDLTSGVPRSLKWPSILSWLDEIIPQPHGTLVAVGFADPAYPGPAQAEDVWILETATGKFTHLPGFPAQVDLKFSSMAWTSDDRLVLLLQGGGRTVLAVWRPGSRALPLRTVTIPARTGGSDSFAPLVGP